MIRQILKAISATPGKAPGTTRATNTVAKLIDTTTCIGCKACEVACQEWNNQPVTFANFEGTYQTFPDLQPNFWNLIKFNEHETDAGAAAVAHVEVSVHALRRSGMPQGMPGARRDRAACERDRRFQLRQLHRLRVLHHRLSVRRAEAESDKRKVSKCSLCVDRVDVGLEPACIKACPTNCLSFGTREDLLRKAEDRVDVLKSDGFATAGIYNPPGSGARMCCMCSREPTIRRCTGCRKIRRFPGASGCGRARSSGLATRC